MASAAFPEEILGRAVLRDGFQYSRHEAIERTQMDSGLARGRLFNSNPLARVPCQFAWNELQVQFFEAWLQTVAQRGARWFSVYLPLEGVTYRQVLARVASTPPRRPRGALKMTVPVEFEIHDALILPDGIVDLVLEFGASGVQDMSSALQNVTLRPFLDLWSENFVV